MEDTEIKANIKKIISIGESLGSGQLDPKQSKETKDTCTNKNKNIRINKIKTIIFPFVGLKNSFKDSYFDLPFCICIPPYSNHQHFHQNKIYLFSFLFIYSSNNPYSYFNLFITPSNIRNKV